MVIPKLQRISAFSNPATDVITVSISQGDSYFCSGVVPAGHIVCSDFHGSILLAPLVNKGLADSNRTIR